MFGKGFTEVMCNLFGGGDTANDTTLATGSMSYDLVIKYVDKDRDERNRAFATSAERQSYADDIVGRNSVFDVDSEHAIEKIEFEDRLVFWRYSADTPDLSQPAPVHPGSDGDGDLILRLQGSGNSSIEINGYSMSKVRRLLDRAKSTLDFDAQEASLIRRKTAYERRSILVKV